MYYKDKTNFFKISIDSVITSLHKNKKHYLENPKQLSFLMKEYNYLTIAGSYHPDKPLDEFDNPKYPFGALNDKLSNVVFDAWGYWTRNTEMLRRHGNKPQTKLEKKLKKTAPEHLKAMLDPKNFRSKFFEDKWSAYNYLFNLYGTGMEWSNDGYLMKQEDQEGEIWAETQELPVHLASVLNFKNHPDYKKGRSLYDNEVNNYHKSYKFLLDNLEMQPDPKKIINELLVIAKKKNNGKNDPKITKFFKNRLNMVENSPIKKAYALPGKITEGYSFIATMPKNVHPSYIKAGLEWCAYMIQTKKHKINHEFAKSFIKEHEIQK